MAIYKRLTGNPGSRGIGEGPVDGSRKFCAEWAGREEELLQKIQDSRSDACLTSTRAIAGKRPLRGPRPFFEPCRSAPAWPRPLLHAPPSGIPENVSAQFRKTGFLINAWLLATLRLCGLWDAFRAAGLSMVPELALPIDA